MENLIKKIEAEAKKFFSSSKGCHDFEHTLRVYNLALHIGKKEKANLEILKLAALLHDIGRKKEDQTSGKICHATLGAKLADKILKKYNYDKGLISKIIHCIESHRFRGSNKPQSKEAKVLFDADKLDSIGAVGIGRAFLFAGEIGATLHNKNSNIKNTKPYSKQDTAFREFSVKLKHVKDKMLTREGRHIAEERHKYMVDFFNRLKNEINGTL